MDNLSKATAPTLDSSEVISSLRVKQDGTEDLFRAQKRAIKYCEQYMIDKDDPIYAAITNAYAVGYENGVKGL